MKPQTNSIPRKPVAHGVTVVVDVKGDLQQELEADSDEAEASEEHEVATAKYGIHTPPLTSSASVSNSEPCPHCGCDILLSPGQRKDGQASDDAQRRISELEAQVKILTSKAATAVDKLADYEDELLKLKSSQRKGSTDVTDVMEATTTTATATTTTTTTTTADTPSDSDADYFNSQEVKALPPVPAHPDAQDTVWKKPSLPLSTSSTPVTTPTSSTLTRFPSFLTRRAPALASPSGANSPPTRKENELAAQLKQERSKREEAEAKVSQVNSELEELSVSLFQQANEMVAAERKARAKLEDLVSQERQGRAKLEERAGMLEEKVKALENRDVQKRQRLERLEMAVTRIERVRGMLSSQQSSGRM